MNMIRRGVEWHQAQRHAHCTEEVLLDGVPLLATVPDSSSFVDQEGIKTDVEYYTFLFRKQDLESIKLVRGTPIVWDKRRFEVAYDRRKLVEADDPHALDIAVQTVEVEA